MNKNAQRIAIAKALGLDVKLCPVHHAYECCGRKIPNYLEDLNAMHLAENSLSESQKVDMGNILSEILIRLDDGTWRYEWNATASQRAKAFLSTLNLWVESPQHLEGKKL